VYYHAWFKTKQRKWLLQGEVEQVVKREEVREIFQVAAATEIFNTASGMSLKSSPIRQKRRSTWCFGKLE